MSKLRFDGKVAIVTGAGNGLGKTYALMLAERGAKVVVNDLGGSVDGGLGTARPADEVVKLIRDKGGIAVANYDSVVDGHKVVQTALDAFGTVDILINNAGILKFRGVAKMPDEEWNRTLDVHLKGTYAVCRAAWNIMREKNYGRIVNTSSPFGIFGEPYLSNYSAAKAALIGLTNALAHESWKKNIKVNSLAPMAFTRMTDGNVPLKSFELAKPELVAPIVIYLAHESCTDNGQIVFSGGGYTSKLRWQSSEGVQVRPEELTLEAVRDNFDQIKNFDTSGAFNPTQTNDLLAHIMQGIAKL